MRVRYLKATIHPDREYIIVQQGTNSAVRNYQVIILNSQKNTTQFQ